MQTSDASRSTDPVFDQAVFDQLHDMVGSDRILAWIRRLEEQIDAAFGETRLASRDREHSGRMAHDMVSQAGTLGFVQLSASCSKLEEACVGEGDLSRPFEDAHSAAERARIVAAGLRAKLSR